MAYCWQLSIINLTHGTFISGTLLKGNKRGKRYPGSIAGHLAHVLSSYFRQPYKNKPVTLTVNGQQYHVTTTSKGRFQLQVGGEAVPQIRIKNETGQAIEIIQDYPVVFSYNSSNTGIISDIDDTIMVSHTRSILKRIGTILFTIPSRRKAVNFSFQLLTTATARGYHIAYVSKSESNLFGLIASIISHLSLPDGPLILTSFLRLNQLFKPNKGADYKYDHIKKLLDLSPETTYLLLGDDTQRDMSIYARLCREYSGRIRKIYIRKTRKRYNDTQQAYRDELIQAAQEVQFFDDLDEFNDDLLR